MNRHLRGLGMFESGLLGLLLYLLYHHGEDTLLYNIIYHVIFGYIEMLSIVPK